MEINILIQNVDIRGVIEIPEGAKSIVIFSFLAGEIRESVIRKRIADELHGASMATLMIDLSGGKDSDDNVRRNGMDLLTERLIAITKWCMTNEISKKLSVSYFGLGEGVSLALSSSAFWGTKIRAVVCYGGRPDKAIETLDLIESPTQFIVSGNDKTALSYVKQAYQKMGCVKKMEVIQESSFLNEDFSLADKVAIVARNWYQKHLVS